MHKAGLIVILIHSMNMKNILSGMLIIVSLLSTIKVQNTGTKTLQQHYFKTNSEDMKSPFLGLRTCGYMVGDIQKAKEWYTKAFRTEPYFDEPFYVGFNIGGYELGLLPEENPTTEKPETVRTYWGVENIEEVYQHLLDLGATPDEAPHSVGDPLMVATVKDPWGNLVGMIYNPVFKVEE